MNINSIVDRRSVFTESKSRAEKNKVPDFNKKLRNAGYNNVKKDEYVQTVQKTVGNCEVYQCLNIASSLVNQLPVETSD